MNTSKIDYKKSEEKGWEFSQDGDFGMINDGIYVYTDGIYYSTTEWSESFVGSAIARYDIVGKDGEAFYTKEDVPNHVSGGFFLVESIIDGFYKQVEGWLTRDMNAVKSYLPRRKGLLAEFRKGLEGEDALELFEKELKEYGDPVSAYANTYDSPENQGYPVVFATFVPFLEKEKKPKNDTDFTLIKCSTTDEFCKVINSVRVEDKYDWLKSQTIVNDGNITCCGLEVKHTSHGTKVMDNRDYWVSFAPNSSKEWDVQYHKYIKSLVA